MADPQTTATTLPSSQWMWPTNPLPAYFCVVCDKAVSGTDYRWRMMLGGLLCEYAHPSCLERQNG